MSFPKLAAVAASLAGFSLSIVAAESLPSASVVGAVAQPEGATTMAELEARMAKLTGDFAGRVAFMEDVARFVEKNTLATGEEFLRASRLMALLGGFDFQMDRVRYELLLAAIAKGETAAEGSVAQAWNSLLRTLGRPGRINPMAVRPEVEDEPAPVLAPAGIVTVYRDAAAAREPAKAATDHTEIKTIVEADQAVRKSDWSKLTTEERKATADGDRERNARVRALVAEGALKTPGDFWRASLVMQHSASFAGYQLAHELAVCATILGDRQTGRWLVAATYDRMLGSLGHAQRFGTQFRGPGLMRIDESGICDAERIALGCPTLAQARARQPRKAVDAPKP